MGVSEPFIVRRLKAMEEHDIVEGRWETEGSRKVKRYYVKDVTLQLCRKLPGIIWAHLELLQYAQVGLVI
jgi:predicted transcriptional regulator